MANEVAIDLKTRGSQKVEQTLQGLEGDLKGFGSRVAGATKMVAASVLALGAAGAAAGGFFLKLFAEQEKAEAKLEAVIKATGGAAGWTADQMKQMAAEMQEVAGIGDEVVISAQAVLATFKEIRGDEFRDAMTAAADMSAVLGTDLQGSVIQLGKALNDPIKGLTALSRSGVSFTEQQKEMIRTMQESGDIVGAQKIILQELEGEFGGAAAAMADTFGGKVKSLWNTLGDLGEQIGAALVPAVEKMVGWIQTAAAVVQSHMGDIQEWIAAVIDVGGRIGGFLVDALKKLATIELAVFTLMETVIKNWRTVFELAITGAVFGAVKAFNILAHVVTEVLPAYFQWLVNNAGNMFTTLASFLENVFANMWTNIKGFFENVQAWLKGGGTDWKWTGLLEGFESTLDELPEIADRIPGVLEKSLGRSVADLGGKIAGDFQTKFDERMAFFRGIGAGEGEAGAGDKVGDPDLAGGPARGGPAAAKKKKAAAGAGEGGFEGLESLFKRISGAAAKGPEEKTAENTERIAKAAEENVDISKEQLALDKNRKAPVATVARGS